MTLKMMTNFKNHLGVDFIFAMKTVCIITQVKLWQRKAGYEGNPLMLLVKCVTERTQTLPLSNITCELCLKPFLLSKHFCPLVETTLWLLSQPNHNSQSIYNSHQLTILAFVQDKFPQSGAQSQILMETTLVPFFLFLPMSK